MLQRKKVDNNQHPSSFSLHFYANSNKLGYRSIRKTQDFLASLTGSGVYSSFSAPDSYPGRSYDYSFLSKPGDVSSQRCGKHSELLDCILQLFDILPSKRSDFQNNNRIVLHIILYPVDLPLVLEWKCLEKDFCRRGFLLLF